VITFEGVRPGAPTASRDGFNVPADGEWATMGRECVGEEGVRYVACRFACDGDRYDEACE
jgi:hypothetical protein